MTTQLPLLTARIHPIDDESSLARQWRLLKLLTFSCKGFSRCHPIPLDGYAREGLK